MCCFEITVDRVGLNKVILVECQPAVWGLAYTHLVYVHGVYREDAMNHIRIRWMKQIRDCYG